MHALLLIYFFKCNKGAASQYRRQRRHGLHPKSKLSSAETF